MNELRELNSLNQVLKETKQAYKQTSQHALFES